MGEKPRALETQRTGVNSRDEVARSHMLVSIKTRGCTYNAWTGNHEERSVSRNVFRRLGRGQTCKTH